MSDFLILEFGSKSLKIHRRKGAAFEKATVPWALGHEVYREGRISRESRTLVTDVLRRLERRGFRRDRMLAVATGAVRDAMDRDEFVGVLREKEYLQVRVLTGREEASLLAQGFLNLSAERPALVIDIGGGSLEMVYLEESRTVLRDSLPLGAIRLHYLGMSLDGTVDAGLLERTIEDTLDDASVLSIPSVIGTGGPVKAVAKVLDRSDMTLDDLRALEERVLRDGPPADLKEERKRIFIPGLMVLRRLLEHCGASILRYRDIPIGKIFLQRFLGNSAEELSDGKYVQALAKMHITQMMPPPRGPQEGNGAQ